MADLTERGQILLIAAFTLAVTFVALALVVNSAIFTENLASRGEVSGSSEALVYQHQTVESVGEAIAFANVYNYSSGLALENSIKESISDVGSRGGTQQARGGQLVNVSYVTHDEGTRIAANDSGGVAFLSQGGAEDWQLAEDAQRMRNFQIHAEESGLASSRPGAFTVVLNESDTADDRWRMWLYDDGDFVVEVAPADGGSSETCQFDTFGPSAFDVDVMKGTVNGERCAALTRWGTSGRQMWIGTGIPSGSTYNVSFQNGDEIQGNYSLVVDGPGSPANSSNLAASPTGASPYETDALYDVTIDYVFVTSNVHYATEIRVAPKERPR